MKPSFRNPLHMSPATSITLIAFLLLMINSSASTSFVNNPPPPPALVTNGINTLVREYHPALGGDSVVFSPLNIAHALMVLAGGITPPDPALTNLLGIPTLSDLSSQGPSLINSILNSGANISAAEVNDFIEKGTKGLIKGMVGEQDVKDADNMVASALYFRDSWRTAFNDHKDNPKLNIQGEEVPSMSLEETVQVIENSKYTAVKVPFEHAFDVYFVMLTNRSADKVSLGELSSFNPSDHRDEMEYVKVKLIVPRSMTFESTIDLHKLWKTLRRYDVITNDFSRLTKAIHKAKLTVDKDGVEGAAATIVGWLLFDSLDEVFEPKQIIFDKPFLFQIVHRGSSAVLFSRTESEEQQPVMEACHDQINIDELRPLSIANRRKKC
ncbi:hypothetical protein HK102_013462 [Quaeritorhiza haematococci]|nr:hypothetical protein HK102_013462 [Quaeritorhiza haematococci]